MKEAQKQKVANMLMSQARTTISSLKEWVEDAGLALKVGKYEMFSEAADGVLSRARDLRRLARRMAPPKGGCPRTCPELCEFHQQLKIEAPRTIPEDKCPPCQQREETSQVKKGTQRISTPRRRGARTP